MIKDHKPIEVQENIKSSAGTQRRELFIMSEKNELTKKQ